MSEQSEIPTIWPTELRLAKDKKILLISFNTGEKFELSAEMLRVYSPSADVRGHSAEERKLIFGKKDILITEIEPVGNYAVRLVFDDGHRTGIYSWKYLYETGVEYDNLWRTYLDDLDKASLSREI